MPRPVHWPLSPDLLLKDALDLWSSRALAAGQHLGVFAELGKGPRTAARLAGTLGLAPDAAHDLLDALVALGWLQREGDDADAVYVSTRGSAQFLDPRSPAFLGDLLLAARAPLRASDDARLDDALRLGAAGAPGAASPDWGAQRALMRRRLGMLHGLALAQWPHAAPPCQVLSLNDAGASLACAWASQADPGCRFASLQASDDNEGACHPPQATGPGQRVQLLTGTPDAAGHDLVVIDLVLSPGTRAWRRTLLQQAAAWLARDGQLLLLDLVADDARRHQVPALVFGLAQRMTGQAPGTRTERELRGDLQAAGLQPTGLWPLVGGASVLVARHGAA